MRMSTVTVESQSQPGMLVHASNPSAQEAEVGRSGVPLGHLANSCLKTKCKTTATTTTITQQQQDCLLKYQLERSTIIAFLG